VEISEFHLFKVEFRETFRILKRVQLKRKDSEP
jgi:hypothetical protein